MALCSIVGRECLLESDGRRPGSLSATEWDDVVGIADELTVLPTLWGAVRDKRLDPPPDTARFLRRQHHWNAARNLAFSHGLKRAIASLQAAGITPLLFKGGLSLIDGTVTDLGWRWMGDLDMVVAEARLFDALECLHGIGFKTLPPGYDAPHEIVISHPDMPGAIDLHIELGGKPTSSVLPIDEVFSASIPVACGAATALGPSPTHQVLQCILHSALHDHNHLVGGLPLRQLLTLATLLEVHGPAVDWAEIEHRSALHGLSTQVRAHLWLGHRLLATPLPSAQCASARSRLHEQRVLGNFMLRWPPVIHRNLCESLRKEHVEALYHHGDWPLALTVARVRHLAVRLRHSNWAETKEEVLRPRT